MIGRPPKTQKPNQMEREEIESLGLNAIKDFFKINPESIDPKTLQFIHQRAKIAMSFEREMNLTRRSVEMNYMRVFRLVAEDKAELRAMIRKSLPQYL